MKTEKRIKILTESEVQEFYSSPHLTANDQRFFFALNEQERLTSKKYGSDVLAVCLPCCLVILKQNQ